MGAPTVADDRLVFAVDDPEHHLAMVRLEVDDDLVADHRFRRTADGWRLAIPLPPLGRLEYRFLVTDDHGAAQVVLDPDNPERVATAFGDRSVALLPGYEPPAWLDEPGVEAVRHHDLVPTVVGDVPVTTWFPADLPDTTPAPLLVVHDGPEYDRLAGLGQWAASTVATGRLPRFRMALLQPVERDAWYAVNPRWPDAVTAVVAEADRRRPRRGALVTMGASLGGLAALQVALAGGVATRGVFSQSGSFFRPELDPQEGAYPHFDRVSGWVAERDTDVVTEDRLDVVLTCGRREENHANNVAMAATLRAVGHDVVLHDLDDLHNYTAWRDGLEPGLGDLLVRTWGGPGDPPASGDEETP
ncbi:alpha/beta hydrolase [Salsipaludibacter albus]|uniref:alpha/beta hydrolase n=1 Tax=Salsipaludibacter albus TaxID=2849650 RepID=UPI001EE4DCAA|nr:alpha/beta hydrolase-fold protein [Salsipaludibacter albus]MBY5162484.1 esterase [Salsipaludibacter albus]